MAVATSTAIAAATLAATAGAAYTQYQASGRAADAQEDAQKIGAAKGEVDQRSRRRQQLRQERIRRAAILQASENTGVSGSSGAIGSTGALQTNTGTNLSNLAAGASASRGLEDASRRRAAAISTGQTAGAIGSISGSIFQQAGGFGALQSVTAPSSPVDGGFRNQIFTIDHGSPIFGG